MKLIAACAFGIEAIVKRELIAMGYEPKVEQPGRISFSGDWSDVCRTNIWLRCADRVLLEIQRFECPDFDALFETIKAFDWSQYIPANAEFPVIGKSRLSQLTSVPAVQRATKKALVESLLKHHGVASLPESGGLYKVEVALLHDEATLTIDTTGPSLHKRGYRKLVGAAPLKETLAAALVDLSVWNPRRPLVDPFCGSGTIPIEAAMIAANRAPGLNRDFASSSWTSISQRQWHDARSAAEAEQIGDLNLQIVGSDRDPEVLSLARYHARQAGFENQIEFQHRAFEDLRSDLEYGCVITNPPYGERLEEQHQLIGLYESIPMVIQRLPTWSLFLITNMPKFETMIQRPATRRRKLFNGRLECTYYQFLGPRPPKSPTQSIAKALPTTNPEQPAQSDTGQRMADSKIDFPTNNTIDRDAAKVETTHDRLTSEVEMTAMDQVDANVNDFIPKVKTEGKTESDDAKQVAITELDDHREQKPVSPSTAATPIQSVQPAPDPSSASPDHPEAPIHPAPSARPVVNSQPTALFGELTDKDHEQAHLFRNRLTKRSRHLRKWAGRGVPCYRLYERDIPEIPLVVDRYEDNLHITEYERPHERDLARHAAWLDLMVQAAADCLGIDNEKAFLKQRRKGDEGQYKKLDESQHRIVVKEQGLKFLVNLRDYVDTGLFLDHRETRKMVREHAKGKDFLNLFAYTGSFSVYAADGGAASTTTVDLSRTYLDWARQNFEVNDLIGPQHSWVAADTIEYLDSIRSHGEQFDLAVVDPPTYSNSKRTDEDWDVQHGYAEVLQRLWSVMRVGGEVYFSTNFRRFKFDEQLIGGFEAREISKQTVPEDFRNRRIHRCWWLKKK